MIVVSRCYVTLRHVTFVTLRNVMLYYDASFRLGFFSFLFFSFSCLLAFLCVLLFVFVLFLLKKLKIKIKYVIHMLRGILHS